MAEWFKRCGLSRLGGEWAAEVQAPAGSKLNIQKSEFVCDLYTYTCTVIDCRMFATKGFK